MRKIEIWLWAGNSKACAKLTNQPTKHNQHKFNFNLYSTILLHANGTEIKYLHLNPMKNLKFRLYMSMLVGIQFWICSLTEVYRLLLLLWGISIMRIESKLSRKLGIHAVLKLLCTEEKLYTLTSKANFKSQDGRYNQK